MYVRGDHQVQLEVVFAEVSRTADPRSSGSTCCTATATIVAAAHDRALVVEQPPVLRQQRGIASTSVNTDGRRRPRSRSPVPSADSRSAASSSRST
jgi:hypothetical protein